MVDIKRMLDPNDIGILSETGDISWVPKEPRELLVPYVDQEAADKEKSSIEKRRDKAKKVVDEYTKIINNCKLAEAVIEERCKDVKIPLNRAQHLRVMESLARIFGLGEVQEITFEMYKICIKELAKFANNTGAPHDGNGTT